MPTDRHYNHLFKHHDTPTGYCYSLTVILDSDSFQCVGVKYSSVIDLINFNWLISVITKDPNILQTPDA